MDGVGTTWQTGLLPLDISFKLNEVPMWGKDVGRSGLRFLSVLREVVEQVVIIRIKSAVNDVGVLIGLLLCLFCYFESLLSTSSSRSSTRRCRFFAVSGSIARTSRS